MTMLHGPDTDEVTAVLDATPVPCTICAVIFRRPECAPAVLSGRVCSGRRAAVCQECWDFVHALGTVLCPVTGRREPTSAHWHDVRPLRD